MPPRLPVQVRKSQVRCLGGSLGACRATRRGCGTAAANTERKWRSRPETMRRRACRPETWGSRRLTTMSSSYTSPQFSVPSVLLPAGAQKSPSVHKIHILGQDERSKFIAQALSQVYDSIDMLGWGEEGRRPVHSKYCYIDRPESPKSKNRVVERMSKRCKAAETADKSHIDNLIVTGYGHEAVPALETIKDRVDENTTVCLMNSGMGVLEDVRERVFNGEFESQPSFVLGHMTHRLAYNRHTSSVKQLIAGGSTRLTRVEKTPEEAADTARTSQALEQQSLELQAESQDELVQSLRTARRMQSSSATFDRWLAFKLPSLIFDSAVEPVCVALNVAYKDILHNRAAMRMMRQLLDEILQVVEELPEVQGSAVVQKFVKKTSTQEIAYRGIVSKRDQPSLWVKRIDKGLLTDVDYLNGYFLRRARHIGVAAPMNEFVRDMVKAKHSRRMEELNSEVPLEETSIPSDQLDVYRALSWKRV